MASDGGRPGAFCVLAVPGSITGGKGRVGSFGFQRWSTCAMASCAMQRAKAVREKVALIGKYLVAQDTQERYTRSRKHSFDIFRSDSKRFNANAAWYLSEAVQLQVTTWWRYLHEEINIRPSQGHKRIPRRRPGTRSQHLEPGSCHD